VTTAPIAPPAPSAGMNLIGGTGAAPLAEACNRAVTRR
jgi:hypothetical protein